MSIDKLQKYSPIQGMNILVDGIGDGIYVKLDDVKSLIQQKDKEIESFAIRFADWMSKLSPSQKVSVWSKSGEHKGLFTMDNEQLLDKYKRSLVNER